MDKVSYSLGFSFTMDAPPSISTEDINLAASSIFRELTGIDHDFEITLCGWRTRNTMDSIDINCNSAELLSGKSNEALGSILYYENDFPSEMGGRYRFAISDLSEGTSELSDIVALCICSGIARHLDVSRIEDASGIWISAGDGTDTADVSDLVSRLSIRNAGDVSDAARAIYNKGARISSATPWELR